MGQCLENEWSSGRKVGGRDTIIPLEENCVFRESGEITVSISRIIVLLRVSCKVSIRTYRILQCDNDEPVERMAGDGRCRRNRWNGIATAGSMCKKAKEAIEAKTS